MARGLTVGIDGYCRLDAVVALLAERNLDTTLEEVEREARSNDKQRYEVVSREGCRMIRATQGHSISTVRDEELLEPVDSARLPEVCAYGTYPKHWASILAGGLRASGPKGAGKHKRNYIHFAPYDVGDARLISGMRPNCDVVIYIDLRKALADDIPFFTSANGVLLTRGIDGILPRRYFRTVRNVLTRKLLWPKPSSAPEDAAG